MKGYYNVSKLLLIKDIENKVEKVRNTFRTKYKESELKFLHETAPK